MEPTKPEFFCYRQGAPTELADAGREQEWPVIFRKSPKCSIGASCFQIINEKGSIGAS